MNENAIQLSTIDLSRMVYLTELSFMKEMQEKIVASEAMKEALGTYVTRLRAAVTSFDEAVARARRSLDTKTLKDLDSQRDTALNALHTMLLALQKSPNADKRTAAERLLLVWDTYKLDASAEYMKETEAIVQFMQELTSNNQLETAYKTCGLDDWVTDLKTKNTEFLNVMRRRTDSQADVVKGQLAQARQEAELQYRTLVKMLNAWLLINGDDTLLTLVQRLNAIVAHYRQILARKGSSSTPADPDDEGDNDSGSDQQPDDDSKPDGGSDDQQPDETTATE